MLLKPKWFLSIVIILLLISGCQSLPSKSDSCRQFKDSPGTSFQFNGKMAVSDGAEGGSGRLTWQQQSNFVETLFKGPMSQGSWLLTETESEAIMLVDNRETYTANKAEQLVSDFIGWSVPWQALKSWIKGRPLQSNRAEVQFAANGKTIYEQGWQINYDQYRSYPDACLPHSITASKDSYRIKLIISSWQWL